MGYVTLFVIEYHVLNPSGEKKSLCESRDKARIFACTPDEKQTGIDRGDTDTHARVNKKIRDFFFSPHI